MKFSTNLVSSGATETPAGAEKRVLVTGDVHETAQRAKKPMAKKLQKYGNSHALVIDKALMEATGIGPDTPLRVTAQGGAITITVENVGAGPERVAASIACHSAIKVNTPLDPARMEWLLLELAKTEHPTNCPHGRPIALLYSWREIQRAFHRI